MSSTWKDWGIGLKRTPRDGGLAEKEGLRNFSLSNDFCRLTAHGADIDAKRVSGDLSNRGGWPQNETPASDGSRSGGKGLGKHGSFGGDSYRERPVLSIDPRAAARALGGEARGNSVLCPGPGHSRADRSLSVTFGTGPEGFVVFSHAGDDPLACRDHVKAVLGFSGEPVQVARPERPEPTNAERTAYALTFWEQAGPIEGTPAEAYLRRRGVWGVLPSEASGDALRWHPHCPFGKDQWSGAVVALVRDIRTNEPRAIHRTAIDPHGQKRKALGDNGRMALGPIKGGAIKLTPDAEVELSVGIGEGLESTLSLRRLGGFDRLAVWSVLTAGGIRAFPALAGLESVWVATDHDESRTGQTATDQLAERLTPHGIEIHSIVPTTAGADLNDLARGGAND